MVGGRGEWISEFEASLVYRVRSCLKNKTKLKGILMNPACSLSPLPPPEEHYHQKPEVDEMNEVESPPAPEETHVWVQPRVVKPSKTKKTPVVNFMSELVSQSLGCLPPSHLSQDW